VVAAIDNDDFIVYNTTTGGLYYDAGGSTAGSTSSVQIATLGVGIVLSNADFVVILIIFKTR
jgi:hypothetical protein